MYLKFKTRFSTSFPREFSSAFFIISFLELCLGVTRNKICTDDLICRGNVISSRMICLGPAAGDSYVNIGSKICRCSVPNMAGIYCNITCPGDAINVCNSHGECLYLSGTCACNPGWTGKNCSIMCPKINQLTCNGAGVCDANGICKCTPGYRGADCGNECAGGGENPCSGHGKCLDDGSCSCSPAWRGADCSIPCPGFVGFQGNPITCSGHGTCTVSALCECDTIWRGAACDLRYF